MKSFFTVLTFIVPILSCGQPSTSCCLPSPEESMGNATRQMAMFANDPDFVRKHESPLPPRLSPSAGKFITFKTTDTADGRAFEVKSPGPSSRYVFMFHEWWGLNEYIQQEAERLQKELGNVTILALDLYDGKTTSSSEEAGKLMGAVKTERAVNIIKGALAYVGPDARIGTIGWCFGGGWSLQAALIAGKQAAACVIYYGMPETDVNRLKTLNAPILGIFARRDGWITPAKVKEFERAMKQAGKKLTVKMYDADHAFANPSNPKHDKKLATDAWKETIAFLNKYLRQ